MSDNPYQSPSGEPASARSANPLRYEHLTRIAMLAVVFLPLLLGVAVTIFFEILSYFR